MNFLFKWLIAGFAVACLTISLLIDIFIIDRIINRIEQLEVSVFNITESTRFFNERSAQLNNAYVNLVHGINKLNEEQEQRIKETVDYFIFFSDNGRNK